MTNQKDKRESSGANGKGEFYHIEVRPKQKFKTFRTHDVGSKGGIERVAGQRADGVWETVKWLVDKNLVRVENRKLVAVQDAAKELFGSFDAVPKHIEGDIFEAKEAGEKSDKKYSQKIKDVSKTGA